MKRLTLAEWEAKYLAGDVKRFDQKNQMFIRPSWDEELNRQLDDWSFIGQVRKKPGYRLEDQALRWASSRGTMMALFNKFKPNPSSATKTYEKMMSEGNLSMPAMSGNKPPEGVQLDVSDTKMATRMIKKLKGDVRAEIA